MNIRQFTAGVLAAVSTFSMYVTAFAIDEVPLNDAKNSIMYEEGVISPRNRPHDWEETKKSDWVKEDCFKPILSHWKRVFVYKCRNCGTNGIYEEFDCDGGHTDNDFRSTGNCGG